jgi:glycopeptide antibiotics resistance protein
MAEGDINLVDYNSTTAFWSFLIYCLVVIFVAVFFLFYASRVFAQLLSKLIRWFTWRHLKAYIEFGKHISQREWRYQHGHWFSLQKKK